MSTKTNVDWVDCDTSGFKPGTFGAVISAQRAALQLSLRSLAKRAGLDPAQLSKLERGHLAPPQQIESLQRLAKALELPDAEFTRICDIADLENARIPRDLLDSAAVAKLLPLLMQALRQLATATVSTGGCARTANRRTANRPIGGSGYPAMQSVHSETNSVAAIAGRLALLLTDGAERECESNIVQMLGVVQGASLTSLSANPAAKDRQLAVWNHDKKNTAMLRSQPTADRTELMERHATLLQHEFDRVAKTNMLFATLVDRLSADGARAVVFGGWARDIIATDLFKRDIVPADIDIVVDGVDASYLQTLLHDLEPTSLTRNVFGGFVVRSGDLKLDIWTLSSTHTFIQRKVAPSFALLPSSTVFNVESVLFKPMQWWTKSSIEESGVYEGLESGIIDLQEGERPFPEFQAGRALQYAAKLGLNLSPGVLAFLRDTIASTAGVAEAKRGIHKYGHPAFRPTVLRNLTRVRNALKRTSHRRRQATS